MGFTSLNMQLQAFFSWKPQSKGVDSFLQSWQGFRGQTNPPFILIGQVLAKIHMEKTGITLVANSPMVSNIIANINLSSNFFNQLKRSTSARISREPIAPEQSRLKISCFQYLRGSEFYNEVSGRTFQVISGEVLNYHTLRN